MRSTSDESSHAPGARLISRSLAGYLCGTHSGALWYRRGDRLDPRRIAEAHRRFDDASPRTPVTLGERRWRPHPGAHRLEHDLQRALQHPGVVDLVLFGSQARGTTTGFSDVDAILVITDAAVEDASVLRSLRRHVLAAQRAVLRQQPMQHHAFEVATPRMLAGADAALAMPRVALSETRSLHGKGVVASFLDQDPPSSSDSLREMVGQLTRVRTWPRNRWALHRVVAMFALLPALYLQARGRPVPKWQSFDVAAEEFGAGWQPYAVLDEVRDAWPLGRELGLRGGVAVARNPWVVAAARQHAPAPAAQQVQSLLSHAHLEDLHALAREMASRAC